MDLSLNLEGTHVVVTGGTGFIGSAVVAACLSAGCLVSSLDIRPPPATIAFPEKFQHVKCDISDEHVLEGAFETAISKFGPVACCVALASLDLSVLEHHGSLTEMSVEQWRRTHRINVEGTFLTARTWLRQLKTLSEKNTTSHSDLKNVSLIIVGSESGHFGERGNADYSSGKSAVQFGLMRSLMGDVARIWPLARVNAVAPGPVDTVLFRKECEARPDLLWLDAQATTALKKSVPTEAVAKAVLFLASEAWSSSITGHILNVDSGKQGKVMWMREEC